MKNNIFNREITGKLVAQFSFLILFFAVSLIIFTTVVMAQSERVIDAASESRGEASHNQTTNLETFNDEYLPYLVKIIDDNSEITTATPYNEPGAVLKIAKIILQPEDTYTFELNTDFNSDPFVGYKLIINRATPVQLSLHGSVTNIRTQSSTIAELLEERQLILSSADTISPSLDTKIFSGMNISIVRVGTEIVTSEEDVTFRREYTDDKNMEYGTEIIKTQGVKGRARVTYEVTYHDNFEVNRKKIQSVTLLEPISELVTRGTKNAPTSNGPLSAAQIQFLGNCEAGMNPTRNSGNGYYGAFQFSAGTWNAMNTGYARADLAPLDVQIQAVQQLLSRSSIFGQFPGCANQMVAAGLL